MSTLLIAHFIFNSAMFPRFYCTQALSVDQIIELPLSVSHHATRVLRLREGDTVILFNGKGGEFLAHIKHIRKSCAKASVNQYCEIERESSLNIELIQAICPTEKMDWIIQKSVELGVNRIQPITTQRSIVRLTPERANKRLRHWQQIAIAACEQCGRNRIPQILPVMSLSNWVSSKISQVVPQKRYFVLSIAATQSLTDFSAQSSVSSVTILVGPEGGLTAEEQAAVLLAGFTQIQMGKRILRTESAALATVAAMQALWGDY